MNVSMHNALSCTLPAVDTNVKSGYCWIGFLNPIPKDLEDGIRIPFFFMSHREKVRCMTNGKHKDVVFCNRIFVLDSDDSAKSFDDLRLQTSRTERAIEVRY